MTHNEKNIPQQVIPFAENASGGYPVQGRAGSRAKDDVPRLYVRDKHFLHHAPYSSVPLNCGQGMVLQKALRVKQNERNPY